MTEREPHPVRPARHDDLDVVAVLLDRFNREFGDVTPGPAELAARIGVLIESGETVVLLGGEGPDGVAVLRFRRSIWTPGLECYLAELYVVPERRGQGIGRALMETAVDTARMRGADHMDLGTSADDHAAMALYESVGFIRTEDGPDGPTMYFYEREL